ncbi:kinesin-like protein KIF12 [Engraulis encrasicolus]|uniref:kinesin-like protein KIF12 n=1 Tax=Engraulis encrasicolus TaxID=184585 RepID=UPI002FD061E1
MEENPESKVIVAVRVRPLSEDEQARNEQRIVYCPDEHSLVLCQEGVEEKAFSFNMVFTPESSQQEIFESTGMRKLISMAIEGYTCTVFAFGQTGSGKTYTITGPHSLFSSVTEERDVEGLMQRSVTYLLQQVHILDGTFKLCASYSEIYNEQVRDLLNPYLTYSLAVRGSRTGGFYVENLSVLEFCDLEEFTTLLERGMQNRQTSSQIQNEHSSRSHSILTLYIKHTSSDAGALVVRQGRLCVVDLAGSERVKDGDSTEKLLEETGNINRSLLTLGKCITALVDPKKRNGHIPYRDSKLTMLLSDSLGGKGITLMIACVSPAAANLQETMNTLRYSSKAKRIRNKPVAKNNFREQILATLQREIRLLKEENTQLRQHLPKCLEDCESGSSISSSSTASGSTDPLVEDMRSATKSTSEAGLRSLLQDLMREVDKLQRDKRVLLDKQENSDQQRERLSQENSRLIRKLRDLERVICSSPYSSSSYSGMSLESGGSSGISSSGVSSQSMSLPSGSQLSTPPEQSPSQSHYPITFCCTCSTETHHPTCHHQLENQHLQQPKKLQCVQHSTSSDRHPEAAERRPRAGQEATGEQPVPGALSQHRRRRSQGGGYAGRFKDMLEARAQKAQSADGHIGRPHGGPAPAEPPLVVKKKNDTNSSSNQ